MLLQIDFPIQFLFYSKALKNISKSQEECKILSVLSLLLKDIYMVLTSFS